MNKMIELLVKSDLKESELVELLKSFNLKLKYAPKYSRGSYYFIYEGNSQELEMILKKVKENKDIYEIIPTKIYSLMPSNDEISKDELE